MVYESLEGQHETLRNRFILPLDLLVHSLDPLPH